ncbi:MAG: DUF2057 family protein [Shewanella sp.]
MKIKQLNKNILSLLILLSTLPSVANAATLNATNELTITSVNGIATTQFSPIELTENKMLIELRYQDMFSYRADDSRSWVRSAPLYLILNIDPATNNEYRLKIPPISNKADAKKFLKNPYVSLYNNNTEVTEHPLLSQSQLFTKILVNNDLL